MMWYLSMLRDLVQIEYKPPNIDNVYFLIIWHNELIKDCIGVLSSPVLLAGQSPRIRHLLQQV